MSGVPCFALEFFRFSVYVRLMYETTGVESVDLPTHPGSVLQ